MEELEARELAQKHVDKMNIDNTYITGITWVIREAHKVKKGYYFNYNFESEDPENPPKLAGGAGFIVLPDGNIHVVGWEEYTNIRSQVPDLS